VTRVEQGKRQVTASELLLLTLIYERPLADLLPAERVELSTGERGTTVSPTGLREALTAAPGTGSEWSVGPGVLADLEAALPVVRNSIDSIKAQVPGVKVMTALQASEHVNDDTTAKAARSLGATALEVAVAAQVLWGRGVAGERDARAAALGPSSNMRARQARRGHITRRLLEELKPAIEQVRSGKADEAGGDRG